jgi:hypothetical protein
MGSRATSFRWTSFSYEAHFPGLELVSMANKLPNELIREILLPGFQIPDEMFCTVGEVSPFFRPSQEPTSGVLHVRKQWNTVTTPLLYHIVILRSKAQANALENILEAHPEFGALVKKLREGSFSYAMETIIKASPNITDLCLSSNMRFSDNVVGLLNSVAMLRPTRLVILDSLYARNATVKRLVAAFASSSRFWSTIVRRSCFSYNCWNLHRRSSATFISLYGALPTVLWL